jgi:predicted nucleic acid-binding protein
MPNTVLVDTGFLIALFDAIDSRHDSAKQVLSDLLRPERVRLVTVWPTIVEACFFLDPRGKNALLEWIRRGALYLRHIEDSDVPLVAAVIERYADHNLDLADACMVWLAGVEGVNRVLTTDRKDFDRLRTPDGKPFQRVWVSP